MPTWRNPATRTGSILAYLAANHRFDGPITATHLRRGFNDSYRVEASDARFFFRVYLNGKYYIRNVKDMRFELEFLRLLDEHSVPVAAPIPRNDGQLIGRIGRRYVALFTWAKGDAIVGSIGAPSGELGEIVGQIHRLGERFARTTRLPRYHLDRRYLIDEPIRHIRAEFSRQNLEGELDFLNPVADELNRRLSILPKEPPDYGLIHVDLHRGNIHYDGAFTLFDFDHCAYGYRACDLYMATTMIGGSAWDDFLEGYRGHQPLTVETLAAVPLFGALRTVWDIGDIYAMGSVWGSPRRTKT